MNDKKPFAEKHPKLNFLLGLFLLLGIVSFAGWFIYSVCEFAITGIKNLIDVVSDLDAVVIVALITGSVSIVGVIISSIVAKIVDYRKSRKEYLTQKREIPYGEFVDMIYKIQKNGKTPGVYSEKEMLEDLSKFSKQITLWGSSKVINKWIQFRENGSNPDKAKENIFLMEEIMNEMRKDLGLKRVKKGNLLGFFVNDIKEVLKNK